MKFAADYRWRPRQGVEGLSRMPLAWTPTAAIGNLRRTHIICLVKCKMCTDSLIKVWLLYYFKMPA